MQLGMIGLGRMGANMVRRLMRGGHAVRRLRPSAGGGRRRWPKEGAAGIVVAGRLRRQADAAPRRLADGAGRRASTDRSTSSRRCCDRGDIVIDGGNSYYHRRHPRGPSSCEPRGIHYVDVGTSGGVWGLERGYCLMIGGEAESCSASTRSSRRSRPGVGDIAAHAGPREGGRHRRGRATCTAGRAGPATSSRWSTTASSTASWPPTPRASTS